MARIDLTKPSSTPRLPRVPTRPLQAYIMLGFGVLDLLARSPIGVVFIALGCYLLYRSRSTSVPAQKLGPVGTRRADEVMAPAATALPDWWTIDQYRSRAVPAGDADQPAFPLVDLQGLVTGAIARDDLDRVALTDTSELRLRDLARRTGRRPMVLVSRDKTLGQSAGPILQQDAIAVVVNADRHPLGVITRTEIAHAKELAG